MHVCNKNKRVGSCLVANQGMKDNFHAFHICLNSEGATVSRASGSVKRGQILEKNDLYSLCYTTQFPLSCTL